MVNAAVEQPAQLVLRTWDSVRLIWRASWTIRIRAGLTALFGVAMLASLATYHADDPSWNVASSEPVRNLLGSSGASLADCAIQSIGLASWILALVLMCAGVAKAGAQDLNLSLIHI